MLPMSAVIPSEHEDDRQSDQIRKDSYLTELLWPVERLADVFQYL